MNRLRRFWLSLFDIRAGEGWRVTYMGLYLMLVLFAYYIIKPVSRGMFLFEFDIDKLPYLYIVIAAAGGAMAYVYTKVAIRSSLKTAVTGATAFMAGSLVLIWWLLSFQWDWMLYVFNAFVSLFSITLVSQGWLIAANIFTTAEAKRVYGVLGLGSVLGAAFGGSFTAAMVHVIGTRNLLLASAALVVLAYLCFVATLRHSQGRMGQARAAEEEESFTMRDVLDGVKRYRHLQVIIAIITLTYIVDVTVEFQFNAMVKGQHEGNQREIVAFLGQFFGIWLNLVNFIFQAFLTAWVVSRFGVGGALQIMPVSIAIASAVVFSTTNVLSTAATRLTEAATRYTFNKTGMELLYLPLPIELRNRTKAFTDIFVDRFARGIGGVLLIFLTGTLGLTVQQLSLVVLSYCGVWIILSVRARREYIATVRKRLELRRLDLAALRVNVNEAGTIRLLEETSETDNPRQATYALGLLAEARGYPLERRLEKLADSKLPEVRGKVYELAAARGITKFYDQALAELRSSRLGDETAVVRPAVEYALAVASDPADLAKRLLTHPNEIIATAAVEALAKRKEAAAGIITPEWIAEAASSPDAGRRVLAAAAIRVRGDQDTPALYRLLRDENPRVAAAAARTAGELQNRAYLDGLLRLLANPRLRRQAIEALASFGEKIVGTLGDVLLDTTTPLPVRRQIPRVLKRIPSQRSVDVLFLALSESDLTVRSAVLKALNSLRETNPKLNYGRESVTQFIWNEARYYYEMSASLSAFKEKNGTPAARLLVETLEERLRLALERLFRLLGLRYPPREIYAAYLAVNRKRSDQYTAAIDFLDNVLERELKRIIMPLLEDDPRLVEVGRAVFGVEPRDPRSALKELIRSGDNWLVACAVATAAELGIRELREEIEPLAHRAGTDVGPVAQSALAALAS